MARQFMKSVVRIGHFKLDDIGRKENARNSNNNAQRDSEEKAAMRLKRRLAAVNENEICDADSFKGVSAHENNEREKRCTTAAGILMGTAK